MHFGRRKPEPLAAPEQALLDASSDERIEVEQPLPIHRRPLRSAFQTLRVRLAAWNTLVVVLTVLITLVAVREGSRLLLLRATDEMLLEETLELALGIEAVYPDSEAIYQQMDQKARGHQHRHLFVQLLNPDGDVLRSSPNTPAISSVSLPLVQGANLFRVGLYKIAQRKMDRARIPNYIVRVGCSVDMVDEEVQGLSRIIMQVGLAIIIVSPFGGYWLAGRATRPLARINQTASRLRPRHMEERLPIRGTDDELDHLSSTINRFLDQIADYLQRNREFVANAAHELRSPLAAIQSCVEVALNSDRSTDEYKDLLFGIVEQCRDLGGLVNQLLLLAESDAGGMRIESAPIELGELVEGSMEMFRPAAEERGLKLDSKLQSQLALRGDRNRLRQVVNNLLDNAIKFTPGGGRVTVRLTDDLEKKQVVLRVSDTGPGIAADDLPHIFERFFRGDKSRRRQHGARGNGLGLSICHSIVQAHGGELSVQSTLGQGATFTVRLRAAESLPTVDPPALAVTDVGAVH